MREETPPILNHSLIIHHILEEEDERKEEQDHTITNTIKKISSSKISGIRRGMLPNKKFLKTITERIPSKILKSLRVDKIEMNGLKTGINLIDSISKSNLEKIPETGRNNQDQKIEVLGRIIYKSNNKNRKKLYTQMNFSRRIKIPKAYMMRILIIKVMISKIRNK